MTEYICDTTAMDDGSWDATISEEIIRCHDCKHMYEMMDGFECERRSSQYHSTEPNGFCSWAERKEDQWMQ